LDNSETIFTRVVIDLFQVGPRLLLVYWLTICKCDVKMAGLSAVVFILVGLPLFVLGECSIF